MPPQKISWAAIKEINFHKKKKAAAKAAAMAAAAELKFKDNNMTAAAAAEMNAKDEDLAAADMTVEDKKIAAAAEMNAKDEDLAAADMTVEDKEIAAGEMDTKDKLSSAMETDKLNKLLKRLPNKNTAFPIGTEVCYIFEHKMLPFLKVGKHVIKTGFAADRLEGRDNAKLSHPKELDGHMEAASWNLVTAAPLCYSRVEQKLHWTAECKQIDRTEFHPASQLTVLVRILAEEFEKNVKIAKEVLQILEPTIPAKPAPAPLTAAAVEQEVVPVRIATLGVLALKRKTFKIKTPSLSKYLKK